ncbi:MAG: glycoside hydrolase family 11 protein, partial [Ruminococcus sp.]|nr:glycoside hydrolase family 11 protein [Ruminococcus sp.]
MRNSILKRAASTAIAGLLAITSAPFLAKENDAKAASVGQTFTLNGSGRETGTCDGYNFEIWQEDTPNTSSMTLGSDGAFSTKWQCGPNGSKGNFLARRGFNYGKDNPKHWQDYGNFTCDFDCEWSAGTAGNSRLCIYGWTQNPLVEYYIVEDWKNWVPSASNSGGTAKGTATIDGSTYDIFTCPRDSYTIEGNKPFTQYFSVRKSPRSSGVISIYKHFEAWESLGMEMGGFYEVAFNVEGWESDGQANVKKNVISYGSDPVPTDPPKEPDGPGSDGKYFSSSFESGKDDWASRGEATVSLDTSAYYEGSQSLKISGRTDNWHGAAIALNSDQFVPGYSYSFDAAALQKSGKSATLQLTLQQGSGESATYTQIAEATAKSGEWTALSNKSFTIPSGTGDLLLYIESPDSLTDIWLDNVTVAKDGTAGTVVTGKGTAGSTSEPTTDPTSDPTSYIWGDANCNGEVTLNDAVAILQYVALPAKYPLSELGMIQADVDGKSGISGMDALSIQKYDAKLIKKLPEGDIPTVTTSGQKKTEPTVTTEAADTPATLHSASFNSGMDGWTSRGNTTLTTDSESYYSAGSSVKVSGRSDTWQGIAYDLSKIAKAGETYSFSAAVMQGSGADVDMMITLQYNDADGKESYSNIASETVKSKTWTKLENTSYTIPAGATNLLLYVEASSMTDFYLDDVLIASKGTKSDVTTGKGTVGEDVGKIKAVEGVDISW